MLLSWLRYNNFPTFNTEGGGGGGGSSGPSGGDPELPPAEGVTEQPGEVDETSKFVMDAFDVLTTDEPDDVDEDETDAVELEEAPARVPAAKPDVAPKAQAKTPPVSAKPGDATPPGEAAPKETAPQTGSENQETQVSRETEPDGKTLQQLAELLDQQRGAFAKKIGEERYKLSKEDFELYQTEPDKFIAEFAGRIQVETTQSMMRVLFSQLPKFVSQIVQQKTETERAENAFWDLNKDLDKGKHAKMVIAAGQQFRQFVPNADEATFNKNVGQMVRGLLGMSALALQPEGQSGNGHAQPPVRMPGRQVRQVTPGFAPAGGGAAPASASPKPEKNLWESLTELVEASEQGMFDT